MDENAREEDLIEEPLHVVGRGAVGPGALLGHVEGESDGVLDVRDVLSDACFIALGNRPLCANAILLLLEQVERDRVCVVSMKEPQLLAFETL